MNICYELSHDGIRYMNTRQHYNLRQRFFYIKSAPKYIYATLNTTDSRTFFDYYTVLEIL